MVKYLVSFFFFNVECYNVEANYFRKRDCVLVRVFMASNELKHKSF